MQKEINKNNADRHATWLELFYDLVFVVVISQLAHDLGEDFSLYGFLGFLALFIPGWWSWTGAAFYATRFDTDDLGHRILILLQMVGVAALAVNVPDGLGNNSAGFALSYAAIRIILVLENIRFLERLYKRELSFLQTTYEAVAKCAKWARDSLERALSKLSNFELLLDKNQ